MWTYFCAADDLVVPIDIEKVVEDTVLGMLLLRQCAPALAKALRRLTIEHFWAQIAIAALLQAGILHDEILATHSGHLNCLWLK